MPIATSAVTLRRLTAIVFVQWMGATLGLPLLALFFVHRGGSPRLIGLIVASFFISGLATQFFMGRLADIYGRRRVLVSGLILYGVSSMTYLLPLHAAWFTMTRVVQGGCAGAIEVASMSAVAALFSEHERGTAVSRIMAAALLGMAVGPMAGVVVTVNTLQWAFFASGVASLIAAVIAAKTPLGDVADDEAPLPPVRWTGQLVGALVAAAAVGLVIGVYETCWSMLMHAHHATQLEIRLSWTLFCLPWVALSKAGGWIADHWNRKVAASLGVCNAAIFLSIYPHIHNNVVLLFIGSLESIGASLTMPSTSSLLSQGSHDREFGRRQGLSTTAQTATLAFSALISGYLFSRNTALPFTTMAIAAGTMGIATAWLWRHTQGYVRATSPSDS